MGQAPAPPAVTGQGTNQRPTLAAAATKELPTGDAPGPLRLAAPIRLAALDGKTSYFAGVKPKDVPVQAVQPTDNPDLIWDPVSHDVIAWGDVVAYGIDVANLPTVVDRTAAIRELKTHCDPVAADHAHLARRSPTACWPDRRS